MGVSIARAVARVGVSHPRLRIWARVTLVLRMKMFRTITVDCLVRRASGGPVMLVTAIVEGEHGDGPFARCTWFDVDKLASSSVPVEQLILMTYK